MDEAYGYPYGQTGELRQIEPPPAGMAGMTPACMMPDVGKALGVASVPSVDDEGAVSAPDIAERRRFTPAKRKVSGDWMPSRRPSDACIGTAAVEEAPCIEG